MDVTQVTDREHLLELTGDDPFARWDTQGCGWALGRAVAVRRITHHRGLSLFCWGPHADVAALLDALTDAGELARLAPTSLTVPLADAVVLDGRPHLRDHGEWAWLWTQEAPPPQPGEDDMVVLDDAADAAEIASLEARDNPLAEGFPGSGASELWLGVRHSGRIVACGALHRLATGTPHLAGILVARHTRGLGYGRAVTAALTRAALAADGVATLGMYAHNTAAGALYERLGYRVAHTWASRGYASML